MRVGLKLRTGKKVYGLEGVFLSFAEGSEVSRFS
jgi:hypothetical protein